MKFRAYVEVDVSKSIAETIKRNGFNVCPDGSAMQLKVPHSPTIPKRKTKIVFVEDPCDTLKMAVDSNIAFELLRRIYNSAVLCNDSGQHWHNEIKEFVDGSCV